jgi:type I restriction enzyme S subunit
MSAGMPKVPLAAILSPVSRLEAPIPGKIYRQLGVKLWGVGAYERESIDGAATKYGTLSRVEPDDIVVNKIWARNGSVAVVEPALGGCYVSGEFPTFVPDRSRLLPRWVHWLTRTAEFWMQCAEKSRGTSGQNRIKPEQFLTVEIPLPSVTEQKRILARIEALAANISEAHLLRHSEESDLRGMLGSVFRDITKRAPYRLFGEAAPLVRRAVSVSIENSYPELGIRSFGKGTFHKPALTGFELGNKRVFRIEADDLIFTNVFAWEGAIAVADAADAGRFGSHRYITCVPRKEIATSRFLCFYFLTPEGLTKIGEASPGGAGRNRTLGLEALAKIEVPVPQIELQHWFDEIQSKVDILRRLQGEVNMKLDALLPSVLDRAFNGQF